jgi:hypothetical protein
MAKLSATAAAQESEPTPSASRILSQDAAKLGHEQLTALLGRDAALQIPALSSTSTSVGSASSPAASVSAPADAGRAVYSTIPAAFWSDPASDPDSCASADAAAVSRPVQRSVLSASAHE